MKEAVEVFSFIGISIVEGMLTKAGDFIVFKVPFIFERDRTIAG